MNSLLALLFSVFGVLNPQQDANRSVLLPQQIKKIELSDSTMLKEVQTPFIANHWGESPLLEDGTIGLAGPRRGGWSSLNIKPDGTVSYNGALSCGFGSVSKGTWNLDDANRLTINLTSKEGYFNKPGIEEIDKTINYIVKHLDATSLILETISTEANPTVRQLAFLSKSETRRLKLEKEKAGE